MATIKDMKKAGEITGVDAGGTGPGLYTENSDTTADIKAKLAKKIGYSNGPSMPPLMQRPFTQFKSILKKKQIAKKDKKIG